jgi:hypothetical protein
MRRRIHANLSLHVMGLLFIPSGPRTKLCAWEEEDSEGHVLWEGCRKRENENERDREEAGRGGGGGGRERVRVSEAERETLSLPLAMT